MEIGLGLEAALRLNLERVVTEVDDLQRRQAALLATADSVLDPDSLAPQLQSARQALAKVSSYRGRCLALARATEAAERRALALERRAVALRVGSVALASQQQGAGPSAELQAAAAAVAAAAAAGGCFFEEGRFFFRVAYRGGVSVRRGPSLDAPRLGPVLPCGALFEGRERRAPPGEGGTVFVRLVRSPTAAVEAAVASTGGHSGDAEGGRLLPGEGGEVVGPAEAEEWVFEAKHETPILERISPLAFEIGRRLEREAAALAEALAAAASEPLAQGGAGGHGRATSEDHHHQHPSSHPGSSGAFAQERAFSELDDDEV